MFNLQGSEIIIILLLALVVLGPEKLPDAMRKAGQFYAELKKMSTGFQSEFRAAIDEPLKELKDTANTLRDSADFTKLQSGERPEKPKSAEMLAPEDPDAVPTENLPFQPESTDAPEQDERASLSDVIVPGGAAAATTTPDEVAEETTKPEPFSGAQKSSAGPPTHAPLPTPPPPFSSSHASNGAVPAENADDTDGVETAPDPVRGDAFGELREAVADPAPMEPEQSGRDSDAQEPPS